MPGHRKRRQFKQTDAFTRGMVIGLKRAGWSIRQIAADTHLGASTVHRLWRRWLEQGNVAIYRNVGATRVTSARVDRRILRQAVAAPQATCTAILQHVQDTLDHSISTRTISRRLVANGLHSCRPLRRLPLTPPNRRQRLEWCRARSTCMTEWHRVVFSDESRFCLSSDSRRVRVWRRRGERSNPAAIVERPTVRQRGIMVWGAIAYDSRSPLLPIQDTMTAQRYVDDVLRPVTLPYLQGVPNALYQQDNARPHTARISQQALQDVQMLPWPPYSPDLSPIEHVWDIIGRRLHALPQPRSEDELWQMVEREWRAIPQDAIRTLIDSLPRRVAACIAVRVCAERAIKGFCNGNRGNQKFEAVPNVEADAFAADSNMSTDAAPPYPWSGTLAEVYQLGQLESGFLKRSTPLLTMLLLVRDCLFVRVILLVSQLAFISEGRSPIRHLGTRPIAVSSAKGLKKKPKFCSVFRSELIAIYGALKSIRNTNYQDIWILTDSRSAIQHFSHTGELRDKVSRNVIGYFQKLSKTSKIHFQWIPSHVGIEVNEAADVLEKKGTKEPLPQKNKLNFKEIETVAKTKMNKNWRIPPEHSCTPIADIQVTQPKGNDACMMSGHCWLHSWYSGVNTGGALNIRNRLHQTTLTRFRTGHLKPLKIENNNKIYPTCPKCSLTPAAPEHILACIRCTKQDLWERPLLIIKQIEEHELMEFIPDKCGIEYKLEETVQSKKRTRGSQDDLRSPTRSERNLKTPRMDIDEQSPATGVSQQMNAAHPPQDDEENNDNDGPWTTVTNVKKPRIPPVNAENVADWKLLCQELKYLCMEPFQVTISGKKHIIKSKNIGDFKKIREYVQKNNGGYSYRLQEENR
ncbi:hypothetical protein LAZ67_3002250 [Cordylochernes scorpioides]|uniref:RNase H type-1 domain-containing protein n=1 Tax=Cordylochernes scorpioides TaxID=51811 RepID=A0ABY6K7Y9_9ARAC|nr:hypothetical protein LAZ67_3002250 [Cordylochernes scorpioides]